MVGTLGRAAGQALLFNNVSSLYNPGASFVNWYCPLQQI